MTVGDGMRAVFIDEARRRLATIADRSLPTGYRIDTVHGLKGAAASIDAEELRALAARLETALQDGEHDKAAALEVAITEAVEAFSGAPTEKTRPRGSDLLSEWAPEEAELLRGIFLDECQEHLRQIAEAQVQLARAPAGSPACREAIDALFRRVHTIKGSAGSVGFDAASRAAHEIEEICSELRAGRLSPIPGILDGIDEGIATLRAHLEGSRSVGKRPPTEEPPRATPPARDNFVIGDRDRRAVPRTGGRHVRVEVERLDRLLEGLGELVILRTRIDRRVREFDAARRDIDQIRTMLRTVASAPQGGAPGNEDDGPAARLAEVDADLSDGLAHFERANQALVGDAETLLRITAGLDDNLRRARLVPIDSAYQRLASTVRDVAQREQKLAELVTQGGRIELDRSLVEQLVDPLLHLVRNALAHGIELPAERNAAGKSQTGRIEVTARQEGEFVLVDVIDDGRGIDLDEVRDAIRRVGRLPAGTAIGEEAVFACLFEPGVSTRTDADQVAGRGVGLDVVRDTVLRLGGDIRVDSTPGQGTSFRLRLPLSTAVNHALLFKIGGQVYALPEAHVVEALSLPVDELGTAIELAGAHLPVLRLQTLLGIEMPAGGRIAALHMCLGERRFVVTCDKIVGPRVIVVRSLGPLLAPLPLYAGMTLSGSDKVQLVLDVGALAEAAFGPSPNTAARRERGERLKRVLFVDDSRLVRDATARTLVAAGYEVATAEDGWEAWELLGERRFDAVVTELELPRMDGFELIAKLRLEPTLHGLPVVVFSSRTSTQMRDQARSAGANTFVAKGPSRHALLNALAAVLAEARAETRSETRPPG